MISRITYYYYSNAVCCKTTYIMVFCINQIQKRVPLPQYPYKISSLSTMMFLWFLCMNSKSSSLRGLYNEDYFKLEKSGSVFIAVNTFSRSSVHYLHKKNVFYNALQISQIHCQNIPYTLPMLNWRGALTCDRFFYYRNTSKFRS